MASLINDPMTRVADGSADPTPEVAALSATFPVAAPSATGDAAAAPGAPINNEMEVVHTIFTCEEGGKTYRSTFHTVDFPEPSFVVSDLNKLNKPDEPAREINMEPVTEIMTITKKTSKLVRCAMTYLKMGYMLQFRELYEIISANQVLLGKVVFPEWSEHVSTMFYMFRDFATRPASIYERVEVAAVEEHRVREINQINREVTLFDLVPGIAQEHTHTKLFDRGMKICPYHVEDLLTHLFLSMVYALKRQLDKAGTNNEIDDMAIVASMVAAFCHDLCKDATAIETRDWVAFPYHGPLSAISVSKLLKNGFFNNIITEQIINTINDHMCGASYKTCDMTVQIMALLPHEALLRDLAYADKNGGIAYIDMDDGLAYYEDIEAQWCVAAFRAKWFAKYGHTLLGYYADTNKNSVIIELRAESGGGKSYYRDVIREMVPNAVCIARDDILVEVGVEMLEAEGSEIPEGEVEKYKAARNKVNSSKKSEGAKARVNRIMKERIIEALRESKIVIIDTIMVNYPSRNDLFTEKVEGEKFPVVIPEIAGALHVAFNIMADYEYTPEIAARHGMSEQTQLDVAGISTIMDPVYLHGRNKRARYDQKSSAEIGSDNNSNALLVVPVFGRGYDMPNTYFNHVMAGIQVIDWYIEEEKNNPLESGNLEEVVNYLYQQAEGDHATKTEYVWDELRKLAYSISTPLVHKLNLYNYIKAVKELEAISEFKDDERETDNDNDDEESEYSKLVAKVRYYKQRLGDRCPSKAEALGVRLDKAVEDVARVTNLNYSMFLVKYVDGKNRMFKAKWHIQSRSAILVFNNESASWHVISPMPRGPEVAGDAEHNVTELQDVRLGGSMDHFADQYQTLVQVVNGDLTSEQLIKALKLTSKRDGMCIRLIYVRKDSELYQAWCDILEEIDNPFVQAIVEKGKEILNGDLLIIASNGTAFMTFEPVQAWTVCAMALSYGIANQDLINMKTSGAGVMDVLNMPAADGSSVLERFTADMAQVVTQLEPDVQMHAFEAIGGPNRKAALNNTIQSELATGYEESECGMTYLGYSYTLQGGDQRWIPHDEVSTPFVEPSYWICDTIREVRQMLTDRSQVVLGAMTMGQFLDKYPARNSNQGQCAAPDPEGFVLYVLMDAFGEEQWVYCKAKTWIFYICHKMEKYFEQIVQLPACVANSFPARNAISEFCGCVDDMINMVRELCTFVMSDEMRDYIKTLQPSKKGKKPPASALGRNPAADFKILLNNCSSVFNPAAETIASQHFSCLIDYPASEIGDMLKGILMKLECFNGDEMAWSTKLRDQFNVDNLRDLPHVPKVFWPYFMAGAHAA